MDQGTKIKSFFEGRRRECFVKSWTHLKTAAGEPRIKMELKMPLLNKALLGMPDAVGVAYSVMSEDESKVLRANLNIYCEGMTVDFFAADESVSRVLSVTGALFDKLRLEAKGSGEKRTLDLHFVAYTPANVQLRDYMWDTNHGTFFMETVYSQSELEFAGLTTPEEPEVEEEEDAAEGEDLDAVEQVPALTTVKEDLDIPW